MSRKTTFKERLRYAFDNTMSKGTPALIVWLGIVSLLMVLLAAIILLVFSIAPAGNDNFGFVEGLWMSLMRTLDPGTMGSDSGWAFRIVMLCVTVGGIFIVSALIGIIETGLEAKLDELRKGRSFVIEKKHTLILGWSSKTETIIKELVVANLSEKKPRIVILANKDKVEMEDEIRMKIPKLHNTKVICRSGNPNDITDLEIVNPQDASSIIVLASDDDFQNADSQTIKTILALTNSPNRKESAYHIVAEIKDQRNLEIARIVGKHEAELLLTDEIISRIVVQSCRQSGLSVVYGELLDFDGVEIYFHAAPQLTGMSFKDALFAYESCTLMGIEYPDGKVQLNPPMDTMFTEGAKAIVIGEDDSTIALHDGVKAPIQEALIQQKPASALKPETTLILGWNHRGERIIHEMVRYVAPGSVIKIVARVDIPDFTAELSGTNIQLEYLNADTTSKEVISALDVFSYDHLIVLSYSNDLDIQTADAQTLITLLHLRHLSEQKEKTLNIVSEMLDIRNRELAEVTKADDFIVSDSLISLLMSQVSQNKQLMRVFEDLFDADGSEIYLKPCSQYITTGEAVNFQTVVESAMRKGEVAIGYRIANDAFNQETNYGVVVNPSKSSTAVFSPKDKIIVLSENY